MIRQASFKSSYITKPITFKALILKENIALIRSRPFKYPKMRCNEVFSVNQNCAGKEAKEKKINEVY